MMNQLKYIFFKALSSLNKLILPKLYKRDIAKFSKAELAIAGYKRWVTFCFFDARDALKKQ